MKQWLYSKKNIYALIATSMGLVLYLTGILGSLWWLVCIAIYGLVYNLVQDDDINLSQIQNQSNKLKEVQEQFLYFISENQDEIPNNIKNTINNMIETFSDLIVYLNKKNNFVNSEYLFSIEKIFNKYLPNIIEKYTMFPQKYVETFKIKNNKTTKDLLTEQINFLDQQLTKITNSIYSQDSKQIISNQKFLEERFSNDEWGELLDELNNSKEKELTLD